MKNTIALAALLALCAPAAAQDGVKVKVKEGEFSLEIPKKSYQPGEAIEFSWTTAKDLHPSAWIGLVPADAPHGKSSVNDRHDVNYTYISGKTTGKYTFKAPGKVGEWNLRLSDHASVNDREILSLTFSVVPLKNDVKPSLTPSKTACTSHETIKVKFTVSPGAQRPWIGVLPSGVTHGKGSFNDQYDRFYKYVEAPSGEASVRVCGPPGKYDIRLSESGGDDREFASVTITVTAPADLAGIKPSLKLAKTTYTSHQTLDGEFACPIVYHYQGWVGIIAADVKHGMASLNSPRAHTRMVLAGKTKGAVKLRVPGKPGKYEVRMHDAPAGAEGKETASFAFEVVLPRINPEPSLELDKESYKPGEEVRVTFGAPASFHYSAWVGIIPASVEHGKTRTNDAHDVAYQYVSGKTGGTLTFKAPEKAGEWTARLMDHAGLGGDGKEHASVAFTVAP